MYLLLIHILLVFVKVFNYFLILKQQYIISQLGMLPKRQIIYTFFCIMLVTGYVYTIDWLSALQTPLRQYPFFFSSQQFNMIYFVTNLPICLLGIPIGIVLDKFNLSLAMIIILSICILSQLGIFLIFFFNFKYLYTLLLIFRGIYGITGQAIFTVQALIIQRMNSKYYDLIMGYGSSLPLIFYALQQFLTTTIYDKTHLIWLPLLICLGSIFISLIFGIGLIFYIKSQQNKTDEVSQSNQKEIQTLIASNDKVQETEQFNCNKIKKQFSYGFWIIILITFLIQNSTASYLDNSVDLLVKRFSILYANAGRLMMIPLGISPFCTYLWGIFLEKKPTWRRNFFILTSIMITLSHCMIYLIPNTYNPKLKQYTILIIALFLFSMSFSGLFTIIVPSVAKTVSSKSIGTAFGILGCACTSSQTILPIFNGLIISSKGQLSTNYKNLSIMYISFGAMTTMICIYFRLSKIKSISKLDELQEQTQSNKQQQQNIEKKLIN